MALHWAIALALAFQLALGWRLEDLPRGQIQFAAFQLHKSVGITILLLSLIRVAVRFTTPRPTAVTDTPWAKRLSSLVHGLLYAFMIGAPLTGWIIVSASKIKLPTVLFGIVPWPHLPVGPGWLNPAAEAHEVLALLGVALFALHLAGALRHQFAMGDNLLARMMPGLKDAVPSRALLGVAGALGLTGLSAAFAWTMGFAAPQSATPASPVPAAAKAPLATPEAPSATPPEDAAPLPDNATDAAAKDEAEEAEKAALPVSQWRVAKGGQLGFTASWNGTAVNGSFGQWDSDIRFSPDDLPGSQIRVTVNVGTANTNDAQRDEMLRGENFFNAASMGQAVFTSRTITKTSPNRYRAAGTLALHGKTRPVTLNFTLTIDGDRAHASGSTQLDRSAFGVGSGEWAATTEIGADVAVKFDFSANRIKS